MVPLIGPSTFIDRSIFFHVIAHRPDVVAVAADSEDVVADTAHRNPVAAVLLGNRRRNRVPIVPETEDSLTSKVDLHFQVALHLPSYCMYVCMYVRMYVCTDAYVFRDHVPPVLLRDRRRDRVPVVPAGFGA